MKKGAIFEIWNTNYLRLRDINTKTSPRPVDIRNIDKVKVCDVPFRVEIWYEEHCPSKPNFIRWKSTADNPCVRSSFTIRVESKLQVVYLRDIKIEKVVEELEDLGFSPVQDLH